MDDRSSWALVRGLRAFARKLREEFRTVPREAWWRAARVLGAGFALALIVTALVTMLARASVGDGLQDWDLASLRRVEASTLTFQAAIFWQALGASSFLIPILALATGLALWLRRPLRGAALVAGFVLTKPLALLGWTIWDRARPELIAEGLASPPLHSFPSGHAIQVVTIFGLLAYFWITASRSRVEQALAILLVLIVNAIVGLARVRMGVHWPSDVLAGTLIGAVWLGALVVALRAAESSARTGSPVRDSIG
ncbi:MAG TPA: phosphatase PAP2 family protein [Candidatus Saccharimonadia bacterium]|nr:phosphatase PAP2 family protein [Candidatus Saccharimonadia bacterium]